MQKISTALNSYVSLNNFAFFIKTQYLSSWRVSTIDSEGITKDTCARLITSLPYW